MKQLVLEDTRTPDLLLASNIPTDEQGGLHKKPFEPDVRRTDGRTPRCRDTSVSVINRVRARYVERNLITRLRVLTGNCRCRAVCRRSTASMIVLRGCFMLLSSFRYRRRRAVRPVKRLPLSTPFLHAYDTFMLRRRTCFYYRPRRFVTISFTAPYGCTYLLPCLG